MSPDEMAERDRGRANDERRAEEEARAWGSRVEAAHAQGRTEAVAEMIAGRIQIGDLVATTMLMIAEGAVGHVRVARVATGLWEVTHERDDALWFWVDEPGVWQTSPCPSRSRRLYSAERLPLVVPRAVARGVLG